MGNNFGLYSVLMSLAAGRWLVTVVLLSTAGVRAAEPSFVDVTAPVVPHLPPAAFSSVAWTDFDNDGRLDFLLAGQLWRVIFICG